MRETAREKATRYLCEGRVVIVRADFDYIEAKVRGEGALYSVGYLAGKWWCSCPSVGEGCSHIWALKRISAVDLQPSQGLRLHEQDARLSTGTRSPRENGFER